MIQKPLLARDRNPASRKRFGVSSPTPTPTTTPTSTTRPARLPRIAKGRRPEFYEDPAIDQLFAIVTALTGEISVLFDRLDTVERLLADAGVVSMAAIEAYVPDGAAAAIRVERRDELLRRVFAVLELYAARKQPTIKQPVTKHAAVKPPASKHSAGKNAARKPAVRKQVVRAHAVRGVAVSRPTVRKESVRKSAAPKAASTP